MRFRLGMARFPRRYLAIPVFLMVLTAILVIHFDASTKPTSQIAAHSPSPYCRNGNSLPQLNPMRVRLLSSCEVASGVVEFVTLQAGGDHLIYVRLDEQYAKLLVMWNS